MLRIGLLMACAVGISACGMVEAHSAKMAYVRSAQDYNACLLSNPTLFKNCDAKKAVMDNQMQVYSTVSDE
jgi:hypothetical protein